MSEPTRVNDLMGSIRDMFPKCVHCGKPCMDEATTVVASERPHRLAHAECQRRAA